MYFHSTKNLQFVILEKQERLARERELDPQKEKRVSVDWFLLNDLHLVLLLFQAI